MKREESNTASTRLMRTVLVKTLFLLVLALAIYRAILDGRYVLL